MFFVVYPGPFRANYKEGLMKFNVCGRNKIYYPDQDKEEK
jgi:hypothetical protein